MEVTSMKANQILLNMPRDSVILSSWLLEHGVDYRLQNYYTNSDNAILERIGTGAYVVKGQRDKLKIEKALYCLQSQLNMNFHIGGITALDKLYNSRHFISFKTVPTQIFLNKSTKFPKWFKDNFKGKFQLCRSCFFKSDIAVQRLNFQSVELNVSTIERAILETIFLNSVSTKEMAQIMEMLVNLRPNIIQNLLENCSSVRVKRTFLYLADKIHHTWFNFLDLTKINIGFGKRVISPAGKFNKKYQIVIEDTDEI